MWHLGRSISRTTLLAMVCCVPIITIFGCAQQQGGIILSSTKPAHHGEDGVFRNPAGSLRRDFSTATFAAFLWGRLSDNHVHVPGEEVMRSGKEARDNLAMADNPSITWLGHASFLIRVDGKTILTDPFLGDHAGPLGLGPRRLAPPPLGIDDLPAIDVMLLSHNHYDHLDRPTLKAMVGKERMTVLVPLGLKHDFINLGFANVVELDWWQDHVAGGIRFQALPAVHFSGRGLFDRNHSLWASFAIQAKGLKFWFSGDTATGPVFDEIGKRAGPFDLAMVGIGAYEPRAIMKSSHATPEEAIEIARAVGASQAIGMHWGTIKLTPEDPFEAGPRFKAAAQASGYGAENAWIMKIGETRNLAPGRGIAAAE